RVERTSPSDALVPNSPTWSAAPRCAVWVGEHPVSRANITVLAYAPDSRTLYTGDNKGYIIAWDLAARTHRVLLRRTTRLTRLPGVIWLCPTPDGSRLLYQDGPLLRDALQPEAPPLLDPMPGGRGRFDYMLPDGRRVAKLEGDADWRLNWWDVSTGQQV